MCWRVQGVHAVWQMIELIIHIYRVMQVVVARINSAWGEHWWCEACYGPVVEKSMTVAAVVAVVIARAAITVVVPAGVGPVADSRENSCVCLACCY